MRFLTIYTPDARATKRNESGVLSQEEIVKMNALVEQMTRAGKLVSTEGCKESAKGARVRLANQNVTVTDGPFTESKELIAGFAILNAKSKAEAIELTRKFLAVAGDGEVEIRELYTPADFGPPAA